MHSFRHYPSQIRCCAAPTSPLLLLAQGAQAAGGGGNNANIQQGLRTKLEQIIAVNQLQQFYPPQALQAVLNRLNSVDFKCAETGNRPSNPEPAVESEQVRVRSPAMP